MLSKVSSSGKILIAFLLLILATLYLTSPSHHIQKARTRIAISHIAQHGIQNTTPAPIEGGSIIASKIVIHGNLLERITHVRTESETLPFIRIAEKDGKKTLSAANRIILTAKNTNDIKIIAQKYDALAISPTNLIMPVDPRDIDAIENTLNQVRSDPLLASAGGDMLFVLEH